MNKLTTAKRAEILGMMVEGVSIRAISRMTGASKNTVVKLLADAGNACAEYQDRAFRKLSCKRLQCDEIWSFCYAKQKNVPAEKRGVFGYGDVWTWTAIDADTKLIPCWHVGRRDADSAHDFMTDLSNRLANRVKLTTDGFRAYLDAIDGAFGTMIDYAMLVKIYGTVAEQQARYSPPVCTGTHRTVIHGQPDPAHISTSYVERANLSMRMGMRRFTRLTNAFSKKLENHIHALSIYFMHYNFVRIHQSLRVPPAMEAGVTDRLWSLEDVVQIVDDWEATQKSR
ncbi:MAG TPA: DDE-type integrase/transposase/recombinase [Candidatus Binataceae bacterium]|nr:DDE-type integrase/transposase/recombinase [Candidatus Binataceae bacterium]